ncbi:MAG: tetratricopeptide repeat protein [Roseateles sp.]|jgi:hypothetical protein
MKWSRMLMLCLGLLAALWLGGAQALPTVDEVQAAARRGDYAGAEKMMLEVVAAKPDSARAHYVLAEIQAHQRKFNEAAEHTHRARALDPAIKFTDPAKFTAFEQLLQREQASAARAISPSPNPSPAVVSAPPPATRQAPVQQSSSGGVPVWLLIVGVVVFIWAVTRWMRSRTVAQPQPAMAGGYAGGGYGPSYGPGYGAAPAPAGPGMLGVGLAAAGGVAAGMLAEKLLHEGPNERSVPRDSGGSGLIPGSFDNGGGNSAADELASRDVDFGSGDGWGGGDAGGGDLGGGGGGDW